MDTKTTGEINADIAPPNTQKKRKAKEISKKVKIAKNIYFITINTNCRPHSKKRVINRLLRLLNVSTLLYPYYLPTHTSNNS